MNCSMPTGGRIPYVIAGIGCFECTHPNRDFPLAALLTPTTMPIMVGSGVPIGGLSK